MTQLSLSQAFRKFMPPCPPTAFDDETKFITVNGAAVPLDKDGEPSGNVGAKLKETGGGPGKSFDDYKKQAGGDHYAAARDYYKNELMGHPVKTTMGALGEQEVHFTGRNLHKLQQNMKNEPAKAEAVQHLPDIIKSGKYLGETKPTKEHDFTSFHHFQKKVEINGKSVNIIVDVGRRPSGQYEFSAYNLAHSESPRFGVKKEKLRAAGLTVEDTKKSGPIASGRDLSSLLQTDAALSEKNISPMACDVNACHARDVVTLDASTLRRYDENGFLHVSVSHISKETVNPYYGREIPGWQDLGLDPDRIYHGYRAGAELEKGASTFNGLPLLLNHYVESAEAPQKEHRVGSLGTDAAFNSPYLDNSLAVTDAEGIEGIESGKYRELSSSYRYDPVFTPGEFNGEKYDFVMTNIRGNHVALVEEGRAGPDVVVADANNINLKPISTRKMIMGLIQKIKELLQEAEAEGLTPEPEAVKEGQEAVSGDNDDLTPAEPPADDDDPQDLGAQLFALIDTINDEELAGKIKALIGQMRGEAPAADEDTTDEDKPAEDEDKEEDKPAMDKKPGKRPVHKPLKGKVLPVANLNVTMDAKAIASEVRNGIKAQVNAARAVRPLIGEVDPMAFDSAADIYKKALELKGHNPAKYPPSAWPGMCDMLKNAKGQNDYPVITALAADSKGEIDPNFAHLGNIRKG